MIRLAARTLKHLLLTIALLVGGLCALEVSLRSYRVFTGGDEIAGGKADVNALIAVPSRSTYLWVAPRLNFEHPSHRTSYRIRTNSFGMRNSEVEVPRDPALFRILCLGDETTFAADLPEQETYCSKLAKELEEQTSTPVEVLNAGCPGGCPTLAALHERHRFLGLQADLIILHIDPSDLLDEENLRRHVERSPKGLPVAAVHPALSGTTGSPSRFEDEFLVIRFIRDEVHDIWRRGQAGASTEDSQAAWDAGEEGPYREIRYALAALHHMAKSQGSELIVSTTAAPGSQPRTRGSRVAESRDAKWPPQELITLCEEEGLPLVDASADISAACQKKESRAIRLSPRGHTAYAQVLADEVLRQFAEDSVAADDDRGARR